MTKEEALIRKIRKNELAQERCKDLEEYFGVSKSILEDRKEFKKWLERGEQNVKKVDELESKLEQQPSEDCVSRKRIKQIVSNITAEYDAETIHIDRLMDEIDDMPPVTPTFPSSEDCVSRAEMLKYQQYLHGKMSNEENHKLWEFIKSLPPVTPTQSWIPLVWDEYPTVDLDGNDDYVYAVDYSVPMPKEDEWVLVTDENHNVVKVQYDGYDFGDYARENILAWQPLPKAYKEK